MKWFIIIIFIVLFIYFKIKKNSSSVEIKTSSSTNKPPNLNKKYPPSKSNLKVCEILGLKVSPGMGNRDVHFLIENALKNPETRKIYEQYQNEQSAKIEKEERNEYGDELYEEITKWENLCAPGKQYNLIFKKGKKTICDVVELEEVSVEGKKKLYIKIVLLLPKLYKSKSEGNHLEWEKEVSIRPSQILFIEEIHEFIDIYDVQLYNSFIAKLESKVNSFTE